MILNARRKKPQITFGLGKLEMTSPADQPVKVWLENIFNESTFNFTFVGVMVIKISNFEYQIQDLDAGNYDLSVIVMERGSRTAKELRSNIIKLTIE